MNEITQPAFVKVVQEILNLHGRKAADYSEEDDPYSNFRRTADQTHLHDGWTVCEVLIAVKQARLRELTTPTRAVGPFNESLRDTLIDRAVYSIISVALYDEAQS